VIVMTSKAHDIQIRRIYEPPSAEDGARILVDRLWPRGVSKEDAKLTLWLKDIAPSTELRDWFGHDPSRWHEFSRRYRAELKANETAVLEIVDLLKSRHVTLLYGAHDTEHNNAVVLADYLNELHQGHGHHR
jgi:uncharacterized protein YeaO (DUF488 family)